MFFGNFEFEKKNYSVFWSGTWRAFKKRYFHFPKSCVPKVTDPATTWPGQKSVFSKKEFVWELKNRMGKWLFPNLRAHSRAHNFWYTRFWKINYAVFWSLVSSPIKKRHIFFKNIMYQKLWAGRRQAVTAKICATLLFFYIYIYILSIYVYIYV